MTPPTTLFHALLRPSILQLLRATGYHGARSAAVDILTDLAARYLWELCHMTAVYASHNNDYPDDIDESLGGPTVVDVRMALQHVGALLPERPELEQEYDGVEDTRGVDEFIAWFDSHMSAEIRRVALDGIDDATNYLDALKQKHGRSDDDSKYVGTLLGKPTEHGDVLVEGGEVPTIQQWAEKRRAVTERKNARAMNGDAGDVDGEPGSRPSSSGLSSLGDRTIDHDMSDFV
ncbi:hypothetical protein CONLIGDRAFT_627342 [Coniochaeta ligniaria NRRL 30616]|uniref:Bromodomain associated domain-containing protein n=1 Tax=Coniochaeta ligniaria NRRL 30616 TaxID=1408157 RepID=A0A1J7K4Y2_9PEZI|nr:hypothetical protein CONLIGDRAFT_627342 [Coniochaeta ligniaria NRRL 30616]